MGVRKLQGPAWLIASVCCLAMAATACKRPPSQAPSVSGGISGSAAVAKLAQRTVASASWVRPTDVPRHLAFGDHFGCAVVEPGMSGRVSGTVLCWGETSVWLSPQMVLRPFLGVRQPHEIMGPTVLSDLTDVVEIQGSRSMCGRTTRGEVWCWGAQPGTWDPAHTTPMGPFTFSGPRQVVGISHAAALAVAGTTACAVTDEGAVKCWGDNRPRHGRQRHQSKAA